MSQFDADFRIALIPVLAEIIASDIPDRVRELRLSAFQELQKHLTLYENLGYMDKLLYGIAEKKGAMILKITSRTEMAKMIKPHCPHFDGNKFVPDAYYVPEEELICWSQASLQRPLNNIACKRYLEVFREVLPEESKALPV